MRGEQLGQFIILKSGQSLGTVKNRENTMLSNVRCVLGSGMSRTIGSTDRDR